MTQENPTLTEQQKSASGNGHHGHVRVWQESRGDSTIAPVEGEPKGPGFRFVKSFLSLILLLAAVTSLAVAFLGWHFSMDLTVNGQGLVEPRIRHSAKAEVAGIIKQIHVRHGQRVNKGDVVASIDDTEWRAKLEKLEKDLAVNLSQQKEIEQQIAQEQGIRKAEELRARAEVQRAATQLEQVIAEQQIYSASFLGGSTRRSLEDLLPVRLGKAMLSQSEAELYLAQERLGARKDRQQEIKTLETLREKLKQDRLTLRYWLERTLVKVPDNGTVLTDGLHHRVGDRIQAGESILELAGSEGWHARILIKEMDIPRIKVGQPVRLYVNAFPHMQYKIFEGEVEEVSIAPVPLTSSKTETMFPVKISIHDPEVIDGEQSYTLTYGMSVEAKIVVDRGRIAGLVWRNILRSGGEFTKHDFGVASAEVEKSTPLE